MTYVPRRDVTDVIPNKFEAIRVLALECRRLNDEMRQREETTERKITTIAFERLKQGALHYYDAREKREQERSEAMLNAAELLLDIENMEVEDEDEVVVDLLEESAAVEDEVVPKVKAISDEDDFEDEDEDEDDDADDDDEDFDEDEVEEIDED